MTQEEFNARLVALEMKILTMQNDALQAQVVALTAKQQPLPVAAPRTEITALQKLRQQARAELLEEGVAPDAKGLVDYALLMDRVRVIEARTAPSPEPSMSLQLAKPAATAKKKPEPPTPSEAELAPY